MSKYLDKADKDGREFLARFYPNGGLVRCEGKFYCHGYSGWERITDDKIKSLVFRNMTGQVADLAGCYNAIKKRLCPVVGRSVIDSGGHPDGRIS